MGIRGTLFYLVINCNAISCPYFLFQNCNQCSECVSKVNISRCEAFIFSPCPLGINTLEGQPCLSISMLLLCLHPQLPMSSLLHFHQPTPSYSYSPLYQPLQKSNVSIISIEIARLSNRVTDLPEKIRFSWKNKERIVSAFIL